MDRVSNGEAPGRSEGVLRESEDLFRATFERVGVVSKCSRISIRRPLPRFDYSAYLSRFVRADERTRTADLPSLRVIGQALQGCAGNCKCRIFRGVSFSCLAPCCTALRSRYQSGIRTSDSYNLTAGPMARTRDLWSHYPPTPVAEGSGGCRTGVFKPISLLAVARRFCVLCAQWCQQWCQCRIFAG
jgi:hypothetical protein